jgi:cell division protein ZapA (FtsZ GTPase activity inhibitor)
MAEPERVELSLLGRTLAVRTEASPEYLRSLASYLEERVAELTRSGIRDPMTALSLAALDITDELFRSREDRTRAEGDVGERLTALVTLLDRVASSGPSEESSEVSR